MIEFSFYATPLKHFISNHDNIDTLNKRILVFDWWEYLWEGNVPKFSKDVNIKLIVNKIKQYDVCFFVVTEAITPYNDNTGWKEVLRTLVDKLNNLNVFYVMYSENDFLFPTPKETTFTLPWFIWNDIFVHKPENFIDDLEYRKKTYTFNMLLGSKKDNRTRLYETLENKNYIYKTYFGHDIYRNTSDSHLDDSDILDMMKKQDVSTKKLNTVMKVERGDKKSSISHIIPRQIYMNSHFDIVSESQPEILQDSRFTTEKTGKPLSTGRFFIWYNSPNTEKYLRKFGFELSDYMIDYDKIINNDDRLNSVLELINYINHDEKTIKNIYHVTKEARMHNKNLYHNLSESTKERFTEWFLEGIEK